MGLDANGVWQYTETETVAPFSAMLNRLAGSVSGKIAPLIVDTGWVNLILSSGTTTPTGYTAQVRRCGNWVSVRGRGIRSTWAGDQLIATLPTVPGITLAPFNTVEAGPCPYGTDSATGRLNINSLGQVRIGGGTGIDTQTFHLSSLCWMVD